MRFLVARRTMVAIAVLMLGGCAAKLTAKHDTNPDVDMSQYRTFSWISDKPHIGMPGRPPNPLNSQRIMQAITSELGEKGYNFVREPAEADFVVSFTTVARDKVTVEAYPVTYRRARFNSPLYSATAVSTRDYLEGTLAIDVFDRVSREPAWHGWGSKSLSASEIKNSAELIEKAVGAILRNFPQAG